ncbi:MAG: hypothetical protein COA79_07655 [Planctomycetota bacterium]|nr:MAG: hypothetical protein COA79_07655 [Planctomycetota bacterium]
MNNSNHLFLFLIFFICGVSILASDKKNKSVEEFSENGVLVNIKKFYVEVKSLDVKTDKKKSLSSYVAFICKKGVYSFLETKENDKFLETVTLGQTVELKGKVLISGNLVEIGSLSKTDKKIDIDMKKLKKTQGKSIRLKGVNKCQCGLKVSTLSHSCKLGHLHHIQTTEGSIYHYLEAGKSSNMKMHFKKIDTNAEVYPGNFITIK